MAVKLFVGGLSFSTTTDRLRETFARFGAVESAAVMTDRETGRSRGFGFVEMGSPEEAELAIGSLNGSSLDGRTIRVDKATPRGAGGGGFRGGGPGGFRGGGPGGPPRGAFGDRRPSMGAPPSRPGFGTSRYAPGPSRYTTGEQPPPSGPGGDQRGNTWGDRRPSGGRRPGGGQGQGRNAGYEQRRGEGQRRGGPAPQRRSNDRGRRGMDDGGGGGYRWR